SDRALGAGCGDRCPEPRRPRAGVPSELPHPAGVLRLSGVVRPSRFHPARTPMILGIDIGGTTTKLGLVDQGRVVVHHRIPTTGHASAHAFADAVAGSARDLWRPHGTPRAVGIGAPNANQLTGLIEQAPNLPWKEDVPLARMLSERLDLPAVLGNDANTAALGEWRYGAGRGMNDLLVVTL